jgi:hypothetical protein
MATSLYLYPPKTAFMGSIMGVVVPRSDNISNVS